MGDLSLHFNRSEFKCKCGECKQDTVDAKLIEVLEKLRIHTNSPITITSGNRCPKHNQHIGGSPQSQHVYSKAADIQVKGWSPEAVYMLLDNWFPYSHGIGLYKSWVHIDVRPNKARWGHS